MPELPVSDQLIFSEFVKEPRMIDPHGVGGCIRIALVLVEDSVQKALFDIGVGALQKCVFFARCPFLAQLEFELGDPVVHPFYLGLLRFVEDLHELNLFAKHIGFRKRDVFGRSVR